MDDAMVRAFPPTRHSAVAAVRSADTAQRTSAVGILVGGALGIVDGLVHSGSAAADDRHRHRIDDQGPGGGAIVLPGRLVGLLTGYATIRFGRAPSPETSS